MEKDRNVNLLVFILVLGITLTVAVLINIFHLYSKEKVPSSAESVRTNGETVEVAYNFAQK